MSGVAPWENADYDAGTTGSRSKRRMGRRSSKMKKTGRRKREELSDEQHFTNMEEKATIIAWVGRRNEKEEK